MNTYEFCADWVGHYANGSSKVLDYGCGAGQVIGLLRAKGIEALGCDAWYGGGDWSVNIPPETRPFVSNVQNGRTPYPDHTFDVVLTNQVLEHVEDLEVTTAEIARVLKPGGYALNLFPDRSVWREGHYGIPFSHWFPKGSSVRIYYGAIVRALGLGALHRGKPIMQWTRDAYEWIDQWCYYRSIDEIHSTFARYFTSLEHVEERWFRGRFGDVSVPKALQRWIVRKFAGMAIVLQKAH